MRIQVDGPPARRPSDFEEYAPNASQGPPSHLDSQRNYPKARQEQQQPSLDGRPVLAEADQDGEPLPADHGSSPQAAANKGPPSQPSQPQ